MKRFLLLTLCLIAMMLRAQQWKIEYPMEESVLLKGGSCNGSGNYIIGVCDMGSEGYTSSYAMYVDNEGNYVEKRFSHDGYKSNFCGSICLDDGNAFVVGVKGGTKDDCVFDTLSIMIMTPELEIVEEHDYPVVEPYKTWLTDAYLRFNNYGEIVVLTDASVYENPVSITVGVYVVLKCDTFGNVLKSQYFAEGHSLSGARPTGIIRVPNSDNMMMLGRGFNANGYHTITYIDNDLNLVASYPLPWLESFWNHTECWKDNEHFLMSSLTHHYGVMENSKYVGVFEVDATGHYNDTLVYDRCDTSDYSAQFGSMAYVNDDAIYIATYWERGLDEVPTDAVICMIDKDLNLLGTKRLADDNTKIRLYHCQTTADGGCLVYGQCKRVDGDYMVMVWKLLPKDFVIQWTVNDMPEALRNECIYPNPVSNCLNIRMKDDFCTDFSIIITDARGRKHFERRFENCNGLLTLDISTLADGVYVCEIVYDDGHAFKEKIIKN